MNNDLRYSYIAGKNFRPTALVIPIEIRRCSRVIRLDAFTSTTYGLLGELSNISKLLIFLFLKAHDTCNFKNSITAITFLRSNIIPPKNPQFNN